MKIVKLKPTNGTPALLAQSEALAAKDRTEDDFFWQMEASSGAREAIALLRAEDVQPLAPQVKIYPGTIANPEPIDSFFQSSKEDLNVLYRVNSNLREAMLSRFNSVSAKEADIIGALKTLRERISTLKLYRPELADSNEYSNFSFLDGTQIGIPETGVPMTYSENEGALLLPIEGQPVYPKIKKIEILEESNGIVGNNLDRTRPRNSILESVLDGSLHSWFEYERVQNSKSGELRLIIKLTLDAPSFINRIRIVPVNFGTQAWTSIEDIRVQTENGMQSIAPDTTDTSAGISFVLSPAASKGAGEGVFSFNPLLASSVQIILVQKEPYSINNGALLRYAIGIKEIELAQITYASSGEFLLRPASFNKPVRSIAIKNNVNPYDPEFITIDYSISVDGGEWRQISPQENEDFQKTEALTLGQPVSSFLLKGRVLRDDTKFQQSLPKNLIKEAEAILPISATTSKMPLEKKPESYLELIQLGFGCAGLLGHPVYLGRLGSRRDAQFFELPLDIKREDLRVLVNGELWPVLEEFESVEQTGVLLDETSSPAQIVFGDGDDDRMKGRIPPVGAEVYAYVDVDKRAILSGTGPYELEPSYQSDKIKNTTQIIIRDLQAKIGTAYTGPGNSFVEIPPNHEILEILEVSNGDEYTALMGSSTRLEVVSFEDYEFRNGRFEGVHPTEPQYGTDWENNRVYFSPPNPDDAEMVVTYRYVERIAIDPENFEYHPEENKIIIQSEGLTPRVKVLSIEATDARVLTLTDGLDPFNENGVTLVRGSIMPIDASGSDMARTLEVEVPYINGAAEFLPMADSGTEGYYSVDYRRGKLFLAPSASFPSGHIRFLYIAAEVSYGIGRKLLHNKDYTHDDTAVTLSASYINGYAETSRNRPDRNRLLLRYDYRPGETIRDPERAKFYTPVIRDITVIGVGVDPRLGSLEAL